MVRMVMVPSLCLMLLTVSRVRTAELKVLRTDTVFRSQYLKTFGE